MQTNLKTAKNCALIALVATIVYVPLKLGLTILVPMLSARFLPAIPPRSNLNIVILVFTMIPSVVYYFGMVALLAYLLIYLNNQKEEPANA